jgi:plastocyanin
VKCAPYNPLGVMAGATFRMQPHKGIEMHSTTRLAVLKATLLAASTSLFAAAVQADERDHHRHHNDGHKDSYVGAAFGRGLNTTQPQGNPLNNVILPKWIEVDAGGVVNFAHAGFHHIVIFKPGFRREHLDPFIPATGTFILPSDPTAELPPQFSGLAPHVYYRGINPAGGPPATPVTGNPSNASNRGEPVAFLEPGVYLVICNVRPHLLDGMYAYVRVKRKD